MSHLHIGDSPMPCCPRKHCTWAWETRHMQHLHMTRQRGSKQEQKENVSVKWKCHPAKVDIRWIVNEVQAPNHDTCYAFCSSCGVWLALVSCCHVCSHCRCWIWLVYLSFLWSVSLWHLLRGSLFEPRSQWVCCFRLGWRCVFCLVRCHVWLGRQLSILMQL